MSVYTVVHQAELEDFLMRFPIGRLQSYEGIAAGIENTNYFVTTDTGEYVLTLFEHHRHDELPFFINLMAWMAEHEIPSAHPVADDDGQYLQTLKDRPAVLVTRLHGQSPDTPTAKQCYALGSMLARLHIAGQSYPEIRDNPRGQTWRYQTGNKLLERLDEEASQLLDNELLFQQAHDLSDLPQGIIHADLFRDNSLFENNQVTGLIDFYYACHDSLVYDLAITVNDWCRKDSAEFDDSLVESMLGGYESIRPLLDRERENWHIALRAAALRFWLSRLHDLHFPREGEITHTKNPEEYRKLLQHHILSEPMLTG